jgi:PHP family Zn ribbon phosphoesterase
MELKLDLHTHCYEATAFARPTVATVEKIVAQIRDRGLDGIAITDHHNKSFGYEVKEIVERFFDNAVLIIPGQEVDEGLMEIVELYLPGNAIFRFVAHPGYPGQPVVDNKRLHGIEIENGGHNWHIDRQAVKDMAERSGLLLLSNSDAHYLEDIGRFYNEITLEELCQRAQDRS